MKNESLQSIYIEHFDFILDNKSGVVSSLELIKYLSNINSLVKSMNHTLNSKYAIGFDQIIIEVEALEKGSVKIPVILKKVLNNDYTKLAVGAVFGVLATNLLSGNKETVIYNFNNSNVEINYEIMTSNRETVKAVSEIAKAVVDSTSVSALKLGYLAENNQKKTIKIEKTTLQSLIVTDIEENEKKSHLMSNARLTIISPVLEMEQANWRVRINNNKFSAKMIDEEFLKLMGKHKIAFATGDTIIADIETVITMKSDNTPNVKHYIKKVYDYPKYATNGYQNERTLFNDEDLR